MAPKRSEPSAREPLRALPQELNFKGMARALDDELDAAERDARSPAQVLHRLLTEQALYQRERRLAWRLAQARLPWQWTLDTFPFAQQPGVNRAQILELGGLDFVRRAFNVVLIGKPGTGKTGIAIALLRQACLNGCAGRFYNAQALFDELYASLADRSTTRMLRIMARQRPIVVDELGYLTLRPEQVNMFFRLMDQRYGHVSTIITTNLDYPSWYDLFDNKDLVDALLDRLRHRCITIRIDGPSLREPVPVDSAPAAAPARPQPAIKPIRQAARKTA